VAVQAAKLRTAYKRIEGLEDNLRKRRDTLAAGALCCLCKAQCEVEVDVRMDAIRPFLAAQVFASKRGDDHVESGALAKLLRDAGAHAADAQVLVSGGLRELRTARKLPRLPSVVRDASAPAAGDGLTRDAVVEDASHTRMSRRAHSGGAAPQHVNAECIGKNDVDEDIGTAGTIHFFIGDGDDANGGAGANGGDDANGDDDANGGAGANGGDVANGGGDANGGAGANGDGDANGGAGANGGDDANGVVMFTAQLHFTADTD